jgi:hypothetical protein
MAFITDEQLRERLAGLLKVAADSELIDDNSPWQTIIEDSNESAYQEILGRLSDRGFTMAQIESWSRRQEFNIDIGLFWALTKGGGLHAYDDRFIVKLDRREELDSVAILDSSGSALGPSGSGTVGYGPMAEDEEINMETRW